MGGTPEPTKISAPPVARGPQSADQAAPDRGSAQPSGESCSTSPLQRTLHNHSWTGELFDGRGLSLIVRNRGGQNLGNPEVQNFYESIGADHHVLGLYVRVNDFGLVCCLERRSDLNGGVQHFGDRH